MALVQTLAAPWPSPFFWQSPSRRLYEVIFWAGFGALFYLVARSARDSVFQRHSSFNDWGMGLGFIYGPILAVLISLMLYEGWLRYGSQDGWFGWMVLVAFLLGYAAEALVFGFGNVVHVRRARGRVARAPELQQSQKTQKMSDTGNL